MSSDGVGDADTSSATYQSDDATLQLMRQPQQQARPPPLRARRSGAGLGGLSRAYAGRSATFADLRGLNNPFSQSSQLLAKKRSLVDLSACCENDEEGGGSGGRGAAWLLLDEDDELAAQQRTRKRFAVSSSLAAAAIAEELLPELAHPRLAAAAAGPAAGVTSSHGHRVLARHSWDGSGVTGGSASPAPLWMQQPGDSSQLAAQPSWPQEGSCPLPALPARSASPSADDSCSSDGGAVAASLMAGASSITQQPCDGGWDECAAAGCDTLCSALRFAALAGHHGGWRY